MFLDNHVPVVTGSDAARIRQLDRGGINWSLVLLSAKVPLIEPVPSSQWEYRDGAKAESLDERSNPQGLRLTLRRDKSSPTEDIAKYICRCALLGANLKCTSFLRKMLLR